MQPATNKLKDGDNLLPACCPRAMAPSPALSLGEGTASSCSSAPASKGRAQNPRAAPCLSHCGGRGAPFYLVVASQKMPPFLLPLCLRVMRSPHLLVRKGQFHLTAPQTHICMLKAVLAAFVSNGKRRHHPLGIR